MHATPAALLERPASSQRRAVRVLLASFRSRLIRLLEALADGDSELAYEIGEELELDLQQLGGVGR
jgi:hypothetical protein